VEASVDGMELLDLQGLGCGIFAGFCDVLRTIPSRRSTQILKLRRFHGHDSVQGKNSKWQTKVFGGHRQGRFTSQQTASSTTATQVGRTQKQRLFRNVTSEPMSGASSNERLLYAAKNDDTSILKECLKTKGVSPNYQDGLGNTGELAFPCLLTAC
jgi:hypothetical protein